MELVPVVCAIILKEGKILATQRGPNMDQPLKWEFPGGKLEPGEREREALVREISEELNITVRPIVGLRPNTHRYPNIQVKLIPYLAEYVSGELALSEHASYRWCTLDELYRLNWAAADLPIVDEVLEFEF